MKLTKVAIYLLVINGLILSCGITQKVLDYNVFAEEIEALMWAIVGSFQIILLSFYLASRREEEVALTISIQNIESLLAQIVQVNRSLPENNDKVLEGEEGKDETG
jgi:hypothetical protein